MSRAERRRLRRLVVGVDAASHIEDRQTDAELVDESIRFAHALAEWIQNHADGPTHAALAMHVAVRSLEPVLRVGSPRWERLERLRLDADRRLGLGPVTKIVTVSPT